jgi:hypothetical protein
VIKYLRERRLAYGFRGFSPWSLGSITFGPGMRWHIMAEGRGRAKLLTSWQTGSREAEKKGLGTRSIL